MSFKFNWGPFPESFYAKISEIIQVGLNSGPKPPEVCDELIVKDLYFGKEVFHSRYLLASSFANFTNFRAFTTKEKTFV